jgi:hypothetical protein
VACRAAAGSAPADRPPAVRLTLLVADVAAVVIVVVSTAVVVVGVLGLFVWAAIQDGRDEAARERPPPDDSVR